LGEGDFLGTFHAPMIPPIKAGGKPRGIEYTTNRELQNLVKDADPTAFVLNFVNDTRYLFSDLGENSCRGDAG
jgi:hypothetical protein